MQNMSDETAHMWTKEAYFHDNETADFIQYYAEMDQMSAQQVIRAHPSKVKRLLVRDRNTSGLELFPLDVLMDTSKI
jgi:hypothetical protein